MHRINLGPLPDCGFAGWEKLNLGNNILGIYLIIPTYSTSVTHLWMRHNFFGVFSVHDDDGENVLSKLGSL